MSDKKDMKFFDNNAARAADAEAMWLGATVGAAKVAGKLVSAEEALAAAETSLDAAMAAQLTLLSDRDAYRKLAEVMVEELKDPTKARRFSDPNADSERATLLEETHRMSWKEHVEQAKQIPNFALTPKAVEMSKQRSRKKVLGYREQMASTGKPPPADNKPKPD